MASMVIPNHRQAGNGTDFGAKDKASQKGGTPRRQGRRPCRRRGRQRRCPRQGAGRGF